MNGFMLLQVSESVIRKSAEMAVKDPHGAIITLVSVTVVFVALIILYFAYTFIGKLSSGEIKLKMPEKKAAPKPAKACQRGPDSGRGSGHSACFGSGNERRGVRSHRNGSPSVSERYSP